MQAKHCFLKNRQNLHTHMSYDHLCPENLCYILQGKKSAKKKFFLSFLFCKIPDDKCALLLGHQLLRDISLLEGVFKYLTAHACVSGPDLAPQKFLLSQ